MYPRTTGDAQSIDARASTTRWLTETSTISGTHYRHDRRTGRDPLLVFIPGWCCPRQTWHDVLDHLELDNAMLLVDPPGQGATTGALPNDVAQVGAAIATLVRRTGTTPAILIGHSMGGALAVEVARALGNDARQVICVDSLTYADFYPRQDREVVEVALQPFMDDFGASMSAMVSGLFVASDREGAADLIARITSEMSSCADPAAALAMLRRLYEWDRDEALAELGVPLTILASQEFLDPAVEAALAPQATVIPVEHGGHFFLREAPAATAALIASLIREPPVSAPGEQPTHDPDAEA